MQATVQMRRATPADKQFLVAIARAWDPNDFVPEVYDMWMEDTPPTGLYVAEAEGRIVGCHAEDWTVPDEVYFYGMRISPEAQGKGIGTAYCRAQVAQAVGNGARHIWLTSVLDNFRAHRTVEKNGFVNRGEWVVYDAIDGLTVAAERRLARPAGPGDRELVAAFVEQSRGEAMVDVMPASSFWYSTATTRDSDWDLERMAVVEEDGRLQGLMLWSVTEGCLYVRRIEGSEEAAADLLAFAAERAAEAGVTKWSASLPKRCDHLLAPLAIPEEHAFRTYLFHYNAEDRA